MKPKQIRIAIAESEGWTLTLDLPAGKEKLWVNPNGKVNHQCAFPNFPIELPNYPFDLNAILPLLPVNIVIVRYERDWNVRGNDPAYHSARNQSLALAACEFYLKWKNLWKED